MTSFQKSRILKVRDVTCVTAPISPPLVMCSEIFGLWSQKYGKQIMRLLGIFLFFFMVYEYLRGLIIPRWVIKVPGPIAICLKNTRKCWIIFEKNVNFHIWESGNLRIFKISETMWVPLIEILKLWKFVKMNSRRRGPENDEDPRKQISKILNLNFISIKKHEMEFW